MGHSTDKFDIFADTGIFQLITGKGQSALPVAAAVPGERAEAGGGKAQRRVGNRKFLQFRKELHKGAFGHKKQRTVVFGQSDPGAFAVTPPLPRQTDASLGIDRVIIFSDKNHFLFAPVKNYFIPIRSYTNLKYTLFAKKSSQKQEKNKFFHLSAVSQFQIY
jgi:hypothetical protein